MTEARVQHQGALVKRILSMTESSDERPRGLVGWLVALVALAWSLFQVYTAGFGAFPPLIQRAIHGGFALGLLYLVAITRLDGKGWRSHARTAFNAVLLLAILVSVVWLVNNEQRILNPRYFPGRFDIWLGTVTILIVLHAAHGAMGWSIPLLSVGALLYTLFGPYFPGVWGHQGVPLTRVVELLYLGTRGVWGSITDVSATQIAVFVIFGAVLLKTGGARAMMLWAIWLGGRFHGGGAKVATIMSTMLGTITGSAAGNAATTGVLTIPLMKQLGYRPTFAAATESVASLGGQITPPVLGAAAFVMAEFLGTSYTTVMLASIVPALLFYTCVFTTVHFEALRSQYRPVPAQEIPSPKELWTWSNTAPVLLPVGVMVAFLALGYSPEKAGFFAIATSIVIYLLDGFRWSELPARLARIGEGLIAGGKGLMPIAVLILAAEVLLTLISYTGLTVKLSQYVISAGSENLALALGAATVVSLVMGMGLPTVAAYLVASAVIVPALVRLGLEPLAVHFFVFYFSMAASITPPVCAAVYVTASIAQTPWFPTALESMRLAIVTFLVPFLFVLNPSMLGFDGVRPAAIAAITGMLGTTLLTAAVVGHLSGRATLMQRLGLAVAGIALIIPNRLTELGGVALGTAVVLWHLRAVRIRSLSHQSSQEVVEG